ncbi:DUF1972 domain-containing protein [Chitinophagaceae bacterium LB-8]|uniref:DUF1972 domain-containing protein n=1 Tax=Paraflavisolibacter caeni TaxID=2982496 RepID=A0A9X2XUX5_9BACT|nr:DUF1972 domain-containing protein [Paraflavisolibacter caeni]MCU7548982.1 DUF1972 domain-containing protein [Paraflavisolibacter caeni]
MKLKIAIIGTRGIPNHYGGFEQATEFLSEGLMKRGHEVSVYNSHNHPYQKSTWNGVHIIHCYDPEYIIKTPGQFIYDYNCIRDARKRNFDVVLFMGYTSSSIWGKIFPNNCAIISNMDGLEWKRSKYSKPVQYYLKYAEYLAVKFSQYYIADSEVIKDYLDNHYKIQCKYIPYGADLYNNCKEDALDNYSLTKWNYFLLMARMEPENNIETVLEGFHKSNSGKKFMVIGNIKERYGQYIAHKYTRDDRIKFLGGVFDQSIVHAIRTNAHLYFHGHSVGGTNPSLLEAMASKVLIAAHENDFNKSVLHNDAFYFSDFQDAQYLINSVERNDTEINMINNNYKKIQEQFSWEKVIDSYHEFICACYHQFKKNL